jgi:hypothetical protein
MTDVATTVKLDLSSPVNWVYETDITSDVLDCRIRTGRRADSSAAQVGTCSITLNNAAGTYTPAVPYARWCPYRWW